MVNSTVTEILKGYDNVTEILKGYDDECRMRKSVLMATNSMLISNIIIILISIKVCHYFVGGFLCQPRIVSEFIMGLVLGSLPWLVDEPVIHAFGTMDLLASSTYMFVLGLEMDPSMLLEPPGPDAKLAYTSLITTAIICCLAYAGFNFRHRTVEVRHPPRILMGFIIVVSATSSPVVTRMATDFKLSKSEIGKRAIRASLFNDMICTLIMCFLMTFTFKGYFFHGGDYRHELKFLEINAYLAIELVFVSVVGRYFIRFMNERNPDGRRMSGSDMFAVVTFTQGLCYWPHIMDYDTKMNAFLVGLFLPREGRVSNFIISKTNYVLTSFILPLYLTMAGVKANKGMFLASQENVTTHWIRLTGITTLSTIGKIVGTLIAGKKQGLHWLEAVTVGMLLNIKGYFMVFFTFYTKKEGFITDAGVMVMMANVMVSIVFVPPAVLLIVKYVRLRAGKPRLMGLQWLNPESELRMTVCLHGPHNVPAAINLIEMMRAAAVGVEVLAMDMVEMTSKVAATIVYGHGADGITIKEENVVSMREEIGAALDAYAAEGDAEGLCIRRTLAISSFANMHEDVCNSAQDSLAMLIVLPFHRVQTVDGTMEDVPGRFRTVTRSVLRSATCSVGILVDRGQLGRITNYSVTTVARNVAVVFIGGSDDREALALAGCMARHRCVRLTVIRFVLDERAVGMAQARRLRGIGRGTEMEARKDDEYFAGFYEQFVVVRRAVAYEEKTVGNGAEVVAALRAVQAEYHMFVVGRGEKRESILTAGLSDWAEYPELGPIGDVLAASDFSNTVSVLVVQQRDFCLDTKYISDEFLPL